MATSTQERSDIEPAIGIDIGGTKSLGVLRLGDEELARREMPTPVGSRALIDTIVALALELEDVWTTSTSGVGGDSSPVIGVGLPGLVTRAGVLRAAPNLVDVVELDAKLQLERALQRSVWLDNDATCATVAEWIHGAGSGFDDLLVVTIGTGIGAGIVANGRLVRGVNGFAGELGHMFVDPDGPLCPCGRRGCWERYASGSGLALLARRAVERGAGADLLAHSGSVDALRGEDVAELGSQGNSQARAVLDEFGRWVAVGLANMINVTDPARIVLGGGAMRMGDLLVEPVREWLGRLLYAADHRPMPEVVVARFGESAGAVGAALLPRVHGQV